MCHRYKAQFSAVHLVTALHRIAKAEDAQSAIDDDGLINLTSDVSELFLDHESTRHPSNTAQVLTVALSRSGPAADQTLSQLLKRAQQLDPQNASNTV